MRSQNDETVRLVVWEGSDTAETDWKRDEWYSLENVLYKQWKSSSELYCTNNVAVEHIGHSKLKEGTIR